MSFLGLQILPDWQTYFHKPRGWRLGDKTGSVLGGRASIWLCTGLIISAQFIGNLTSLPAAPYVSDILGRRAALFMGSIIMCFGVALQTSALNVPMFIGARFCSQWFLFISMNCHADAQLLFHSRIVGIGLSFCQNASPLLLIELSYPTQVLSPSMSFLVILKYFTSPFLKQARAHYVHVQLMLVFWKHHLCLDMPRSVWTCGR